MLNEIVFPLNSNYEFSEHLLKNFDFCEYYIGIKNKTLINGSISHHYHPNGCLPIEAINRLLAIAAKNKKKINITYNTFYHSKALIADIFDELEDLDIDKVNHLIMGNIENAIYLKNKMPDIRIAASSLLGIKNAEAVLLLKNLGFDRVILPRSIDSADIMKIGQLIGKEIEIEVFIWGGGCTFEESTCHLPHVIINQDGTNTNQDILKNEIRPICRYVKKDDDCGKLNFFQFGSRHCGICYIETFKKANISRFKVTGRTHSITGINLVLEKITNIIADKTNKNSCREPNASCLYRKK